RPVPGAGPALARPGRGADGPVRRHRGGGRPRRRARRPPRPPSRDRGDQDRGRPADLPLPAGGRVMAIDLDSRLRSIVGAGAKKLETARGFTTVRDMLDFLPRTYVDPARPAAFRDLPHGEDVVV